MSDPVRDDDLVLQTAPLDFQWATIDPFLFCVHHLDRYPAGNDRLGPDAPLGGRDLGNDFSGLDGWRMYHGHEVPGFPQHPHRGFETVTYVRRGLIDHADSLGAAARFGRGDVQWVTAGGGIVHSEMFPLVDPEAPNTVELFQIWLNLPAERKLVDPHFSMLWAGDIPVLEADGAEVTVVAGELAGLVPPPPPPDSWASDPASDLAIWHVHLDPGGSWTVPPAAGPDTVRTLYVFDGRARIGDAVEVEAPTGVVVRAEREASVAAVGDGPAELLVLQGRPLGEPVAQYGPFVMNTRAQIEQAFDDFRRTGFGGWPWPVDDPNHGPDRGRFARHADGRVEEVDAGAAAG